MKIFLALASVSLVKVAVRRTFSNNKNWTQVRKFTLETNWCKKDEKTRNYKTIITVVSTFLMHRWEKTSDALKRKCFCTDYFELTLKPATRVLYRTCWSCIRFEFLKNISSLYALYRPVTELRSRVLHCEHFFQLSFLDVKTFCVFCLHLSIFMFSLLLGCSLKIQI